MKGTLTDQAQDETLEMLACAIDRRPKGAPTVAAVAAVVQRMEREADTVIVHFNPAAAELVAAFVAAEQQCCSGLNWHLETGSALRLRVGATPLQAAALEQLFSAR